MSRADTLAFLNAVEEVLRISDRKHVAWDAAKAGIEPLRAELNAQPDWRVSGDVMTGSLSMPMQWPKARDLFLNDDMGQGQLRVLFDSDNDVCIAIWPVGATSAALEFCNGGGGGGKSPNTRAALIALMCAMEKDGATERPNDR